MPSNQNGWNSVMDQHIQATDDDYHSDPVRQSKYVEGSGDLGIIEEHSKEDFEQSIINVEREGVLDSIKGLFVSNSSELRSLSKSVEVDLNIQPEFYTPDSGTNLTAFEDSCQLHHLQTEKINPAIIDENYHIGIDSIPTQKENFIAKNGGNFTMMVVGQSGLGKTTFINNLFGTSLLPSVWECDHNPSERGKTTKIIRHVSELVENEFTLRFTVIDTPGFGDQSNNSFSWSPIVNYIDEQYRSFIFQEEQPLRGSLKDNRIHCCLYFIKLTRYGLSSLDIAAMEEISKRVNLIPIIAKVDGLTTSDLIKYKHNIRKTIELQEIQVCAFLDQNDPNCKMLFDVYPFGIVCSEDTVINDEGKPVRGRSYKWGNVEVENPLHSEFAILRNILMSKNLVDFIVGCENYYEKCRTHMLLSRINQAKTYQPEGLDLSLFDIDDPDKNGLNNYKLYEIFNKKYMDDLIVEWSPEFIHKQWEAKKRLNEIVLIEETRFKDWKADLLTKQTNLNQEIEDLHTILQQLRSECNEMETRLNKQRTRRFSRLGLSSHSELTK